MHGLSLKTFSDAHEEILSDTSRDTELIRQDNARLKGDGKASDNHSPKASQGRRLLDVFFGWKWRQEEKDTAKKSFEEPWRRRSPSSQLRGQQCSATLYEEAALRGYHENPNFLRWDPQPDKFLVLLCYHGEVSHRMKCIRNHAILSGLLNRTLIVPMDIAMVPQNGDHRYVFDIDNFRRCYGEKTILTTSEYEEKYESPVVIDQVFCWTDKFDSCPFQTEEDSTTVPKNHQLKGQAVSALLGLKTVLFSQDVHHHMADLGVQVVLEEFLMNYRLALGKTLLLGDMEHTEISHSPQLYQSGDVPFLRFPECLGSLGIRPHKAIFLTAQLYIEQFLGPDFFALHFRRSHKEEFCDENDACSFPVPQVADFLRNKMGETNITTLFLTTDATDNEVKLFAEVAQEVNGKDINIVRLSQNIDFTSWAQPLEDYEIIKRNSNGVDSLLLSAIEEVVCSFSTIFVGSPQSTYTQEVERLRYGLGTATCEDCLFCDGETPWADDDFRLQPFREENRI